VTWLTYTWHESVIRYMSLPYMWHDWKGNGSIGAVPHSLSFIFESTIICVWHDSSVHATWLIQIFDMPHSYVWHASGRNGVSHDPFICVTCLIHMCDMPHSYVWHASFICVTCLNHMCDMPQDATACHIAHSYVWHASFICVTWLIHIWDITHMCDMTHWCMWRDSFTRVKCPRTPWRNQGRALDQVGDDDAASAPDPATVTQASHDSFVCVTRLMHVWHDSFADVTFDMTHSHMWHDVFA